jgi:hypothetical protein
MRRTRPLAAALILTLAGAGVARAEHRWGVGLRGSAQKISGEGDAPGHEVQLAGGGLQGRWRMTPRFGLELTLEGFGGAKGEAFQREGGAIGLSGMLHLTVDGPWDLYLLLGAGTRTDTVKLAETEAEFKQTFVAAGVGLEYLWTHFGVGAELRAVAYHREDAEDAGPSDPIPAKAAGAQLTITATYYF